MIFNGTFFSFATESSSCRTVVLPTPGMPATIVVSGIVLPSLSQETLGARVYLGDSLLYQNLVVLLYDTYCQEYSGSCAKRSEKVCSCRYYSDSDSADYCDGWYVSVQDLANHYRSNSGRSRLSRSV